MFRSAVSSPSSVGRVPERELSPKSLRITPHTRHTAVCKHTQRVVLAMQTDLVRKKLRTVATNTIQTRYKHQSLKGLHTSKHDDDA